jgi:hypothetical protein
MRDTNRSGSGWLLALALATSACYGTRNIQDPTVVIRGPGGSELGVSTDYGLVFLGRTAQAGPIEVTSWFGDGPSIESTVVEPVGGGLYTAETEIRLPSVALTYVEPKPGDSLLVIGRTPSGKWESTVTVRSDPRVYGLILSVPGPLRGRADQVGAGVFVVTEDDKKELVGLVSGRLKLQTQGGTREYLTVIGPEDLWRLVTLRRDRLRPKPWVYREDVL